MKLSDEKCVERLARRAGWQMVYPHGGQAAVALRFNAGSTTPAQSRTAMPDWLNSRDALAPIFPLLSSAEITRIMEALYRRYIRDPAFPPEKVKMSNLGFPTGAYWFFLTIEPKDLAYAIAEAIGEPQAEREK